MNAPTPPLDPSRSSYYVTDALYRVLMENFPVGRTTPTPLPMSPFATNFAAS